MSSTKKIHKKDLDVANGTNILALLAPSPKTEAFSNSAPVEDRDHNDFQGVLDKAVEDNRATERKPVAAENKTNTNKQENQPSQSSKSDAAESTQLKKPQQENSSPAAAAPEETPNEAASVHKDTAAENSLLDKIETIKINEKALQALLEALNDENHPGQDGLLKALGGILHLTNTGPAEGSAAETQAHIDIKSILEAREQKAMATLINLGLSEEEAKNLLQKIRSALSTNNSQASSQQLKSGNGNELLHKNDQASLVSEKNAADSFRLQATQDKSMEEAKLQETHPGKSTATKNQDAKNTEGGLKDIKAISQEAAKPLNIKSIGVQQSEAGEKLMSSSGDNSKNADGNPRQNNADVLISQAQKGSSVSVEGKGSNFSLNQAPSANNSAQPTLQTNAAVGTVADNSSKASEAPKASLPQFHLTRETSEKIILEQIVQKFSMRGQGSQREVFIKLDPPSLGTVRINVSTKGESVKTTIIAENHMVKQVIENNLSQLKDSMSSQGLKVESFSVLVGGNPGHNAQNQKQNNLGNPRFSTENKIENQKSSAEPVVSRQTIYLNASQSISIFA